jgi:branched-chain amino acid transport system permease protein
MRNTPWLFGLAALAAVLLGPAGLKNYGIHLATTWLVYVIATLGLNLTVGYAGQKSLGHAAFFGIGAYTVAILLKAGISFWIGLPCAALLCFGVGLLLGFPALRVQTIYLAFATLGFNTALWLVMRNEEWLTGGTFGLNNIARPSLFGLQPGGQPGLLLPGAGLRAGAGRAAVGPAALALGQGLHGAARQPHPRRAWAWTRAATRC